MYESPLDITLTPISTITEEIRDEIDEHIIKEIITVTRGVNINVNKDELIKALNFDRNQYKKGYVEGYADAKTSVIHCKDCKHYQRLSESCRSLSLKTGDEWYCADAERKVTE